MCITAGNDASTQTIAHLFNNAIESYPKCIGCMAAGLGFDVEDALVAIGRNATGLAH